jgi:hypothetical protein
MRSGFITDRGWRFLAFAALVLTVGTLNGWAQQVQPQEKLIDRLAVVVSAKEPAFKLTAKLGSRGQDISNLLGWKGLEPKEEEYVSVTFYELGSASEAADSLQRHINSPTAVISPTSKLENLGDEAYISEHRVYSKPGSTSLFFRRARVVVSLTASSRSSAEQFARHIVDEIGKP